MKSILDFVSSSYDGLKGRESIEWANFWYSQSNTIPQPARRILLIGDSTARMVRSTFERHSACAEGRAKEGTNVLDIPVLGFLGNYRMDSI